MANHPQEICPSPSMRERLLNRDRILIDGAASSSSHHHNHHRNASASEVVGSCRSIKPVSGSLKKSKSVASLYSFAPLPTRAAVISVDGGFYDNRVDNRKVVKNDGGGVGVGGCGFGRTKRIRGFWSKLLHLNRGKQVFVH